MRRFWTGTISDGAEKVDYVCGAVPPGRELDGVGFFLGNTGRGSIERAGILAIVALAEDITPLGLAESHAGAKGIEIKTVNANRTTAEQLLGASVVERLFQVQAQSEED